MFVEVLNVLVSGLPLYSSSMTCFFPIPEQLHAGSGRVAGQLVEDSCQEVDAAVAKILQETLHLALLNMLTEHEGQQLFGGCVGGVWYTYVAGLSKLCTEDYTLVLQYQLAFKLHPCIYTGTAWCKRLLHY